MWQTAFLSLWKHSEFWLGVLKFYWLLSMSGLLPFLRPMCLFTSRKFSSITYSTVSSCSHLLSILIPMALVNLAWINLSVLLHRALKNSSSLIWLPTMLFSAPQSIKWFFSLTFKNAISFFFQNLSFHNCLYFSEINYICLYSFTWLIMTGYLYL